MVWPWKKGHDVVDLTKMRHLLPTHTDEDVEIVDLSAQKRPQNYSNNSGDSGAGALGALGSLASAGATSYSTLTPSPGPITEGLREARDAKKEKLKAVFNEMRLKLDDNEFKMKDVVGKLNEMERRIKELERKR